MTIGEEFLEEVQGESTTIRDANVADVRATLAAVRGADCDGVRNVRASDDIYDTGGRKDASRSTVDQFVQRRGQLTVYLRLLDVPSPQLYGPTADEK